MAASEATSPCRTPQTQQQQDHNAYSALLMDDHPLRSYPTYCTPDFVAFLEHCYASLKRRWTEKLFPVVCLSLMFFMVIQFLASLPYGFSYLLLRNEYDEQMGAVQWPREFAHHPSSACLADNPLAHDNAVQYALDAGCIGAKADLWIESTSKTLVVGAVAGNSSLDDVYLRPLLDSLTGNGNGNADGNGHGHGDGRSPAAVSPSTTVHPFTLVLELHAPLHTVWPRLVPLLAPLHSAGLLSYTETTGYNIIARPVTILLSGKDLPASLAQVKKTNDPNSISSTIFLDIPTTTSTDDLLPDTDTNTNTPSDHESAIYSAPPLPLALTTTTTSSSTSTTLPPHSHLQPQTLTTTTNFTQSIGHPHRGRFSPQQIRRIRAQIRAAHARGLRARYTGIPCRSVRLRRAIWRILVREGADLIEVEWAGCQGRGWRGFFTFGGICSGR